MVYSTGGEGVGFPVALCVKHQPTPLRPHTHTSFLQAGPWERVAAPERQPPAGPEPRKERHREPGRRRRGRHPSPPLPSGDPPNICSQFLILEKSKFGSNQMLSHELGDAPVTHCHKGFFSTKRLIPRFEVPQTIHRLGSSLYRTSLIFIVSECKISPIIQFLVDVLRICVHNMNVWVKAAICSCFYFPSF